MKYNKMQVINNYLKTSMKFIHVLAPGCHPQGVVWKGGIQVKQTILYLDQYLDRVLVLYYFVLEFSLRMVTKCRNM
jgi:hypothetical protein